MDGWSRIIVALVGTFAPVVGVYADMAPVSEIGPGLSAQIFDGTDAKPRDVARPLLGPTVIDLDSLYYPCLPEGGLDIHHADAAVEPVPLLSGEAASLELCLYALMSLGLCQSAPFVTKFQFSCVPGWYDHRGSSQIGRSFALARDCVYAASVLWSLQPSYEAKDGRSPYFRGAVAAVLRKSQFTPTTLAPRGPPRKS